MLAATTADLGTNTDVPQPSSGYSYKYLCTSCQIEFQNGQDQRAHMKESWHLCNLKRRIASLPPIPREEFEQENANRVERKSERKGEKDTDKSVAKKIHKKLVISRTLDDSKSSSSSDEAATNREDDEISRHEEEEATNNEDEQNIWPFQCLFCNQGFSNNEDGLATNLEHMHTSHGMFVPDPDRILDMQSFIGYLATEVRAWNECLYCGATKDSTLSIQNHMRDKGHCLLNLDREPELLDFWESTPLEAGDETVALEQDRLINVSETERRFTSGKVIESRHAAPAPRKLSRKRDPVSSATTTQTLLLDSSSDATEPSQPPLTPEPSSSRQLARRDEMSILGITTQQRRALVLAEKKAQRSEDVARRAREWAYAKGANTQKFDQIDTKGKWGKQNHKLLPR